MKKFLQDHSYDMVKMFLNQFATAVFGFALVLAASKAQNATLRNVTSIAAILFYLFLLYTMTWEIGFADKVSVESGKKKAMPAKGALISLCANSVNFLLAIFVMLAALLPKSFISNIGGVSAPAALLIEGMYTGLLSHPVGGMPLNNYWFVWFIVPIPAILVSSLAYWLGLRDVKGTSLFNKHDYPASDREPKRKRDERND